MVCRLPVPTLCPLCSHSHHASPDSSSLAVHTALHVFGGSLAKSSYSHGFKLSEVAGRQCSFSLSRAMPSVIGWSLHLLESSKIILFEGHSLRPVPTLWPSLASKIHRLAILPAQSPNTRVLDLSHQDSPNSLANVLRVSKGFILYVHGEYTGATECVYIWRSEDSSQVSILFSTRWVPGMELGTSGLLARTITSCSLLPTVFRTL